MTSKEPKVIGSPGVAVTMRDSGRPWPRATWAVELPPTTTAAVRSATVAESMTWS
ncbi:hypothetical protein [Nocardioides daphniae]|uniref:hypothetical protein n=1 Tax=Nocardioides daphniae TaxID=402297 RepID=UPI001930F584|nr:hypothetical protein [Nocardioides daphniae]